MLRGVPVIPSSLALMAAMFGFRVMLKPGFGYLASIGNSRAWMSLGADPDRATIRLLTIASECGRGAEA